MTKEEEQELLAIQLKKQEESRKVRSTSGFYDESYWGDYWVKRFGAEADENNAVTKFETDKKVAFIEQFFPGTKSALDVACSFGHLTARLHDKNIRAVGIDISEPAIVKAPARVRANIMKMSATDLSAFKDNEFELVTAFDVFEHLYIEEIMLSVAEAVRVASKFILIRLPLPSYAAEPWVADLSYQGLTREHVSMYPWEFWARRFTETGKFDWWFCQHWGMAKDTEFRKVCEGWITFKARG